MKLECPPNRTNRPARPVPADSNTDHPADRSDTIDDSGEVTRRLQRSSVSLLVSVLAHCVLVVILGLITLSGAPGPVLPGEDVMLGELPASSLDNNVDVEQFETEVADSLREQVSVTEIVAPPTSVEESEQLQIDAPSLQIAGGGKAFSADGITSGGSGAAGQASFMGVQAYGRRFCIIADHSGSMKGQPLRFVKKEVGKTLDTMTRGSAIHLVFYSASWTAHPDRWADPKRDRLPTDEWLARIEPRGGTNPGPAFDHAFDLEPPPDAIFFMTDGKIPGNMDKHVARLNEKRVRKIPVHTIAFLNPAAAAIMKQIAEDSGGKYRYVPGAR